jgi:hypothetical protein
LQGSIQGAADGVCGGGSGVVGFELGRFGRLTCEVKVMELKRQYIVDEDNHKVAVQLDIDTFEKIEDVLENYALVQFINADESETLSIEEAKKYYATLDKA